LSSFPSLLRIGASSNASSKAPQDPFFLGRIYFAAAGWHILESTVVAIWFRWCRVGNAEDGGGYSGECTSDDAEGGCVFGAWVEATKILVNKTRSEFWWVGGRGWRIWTCERIESYWRG